VEDLDGYHRALEAGCLPVAETERLSPELGRREAIVFGLHLTDGVYVTALRAGANDGMSEDEWEHALDRLMRQGLLEERTGRVRLTDLGRRFADTVAVELL